MRVFHSRNAPEQLRNSVVADAVENIAQGYLRSIVNEIAVPRHATAESAENQKIADWIARELASFGYEVKLQGKYGNVVAVPSGVQGPLLLVGAHYDSVPGCPGADDNASAVAAMLGCARAIAGLNSDVGFVAFNREEDGLLGSLDFVAELTGQKTFEIAGCHVLEMVGYSSDEPHSQRIPPGLPIQIPTTGNFLGVLGNRISSKMIDDILSSGQTYLPDFHVIGLKLFLGLENLLPDLTRSDHVSFWLNGIPATMWTDTADFRNPNYHRRSDTPDTLDYGFIANVTKLLTATVLTESLPPDS